MLIHIESSDDLGLWMGGDSEGTRIVQRGRDAADRKLAGHIPIVFD